MDAHGVAADLGDVLVGKGDLIAAVAGADEVLKILGGLQVRDLVNDFLHGDLGGLLGVDLAADGGVCDNVSLLVKDDCFGVSGADIASGEILLGHGNYPPIMILFLLIYFLYRQISSSKSTSVGSTGSACITVRINSFTLSRI